MTNKGTNVQCSLPQSYSNSNWCGAVAHSEQPTGDGIYLGVVTVGLKTPSTFNHRFGTGTNTKQFITIGY